MLAVQRCPAHSGSNTNGRAIYMYNVHVLTPPTLISLTSPLPEQCCLVPPELQVEGRH